jgi:hypothetical protein
MLPQIQYELPSQSSVHAEHWRASASRCALDGATHHAEHAGGAGHWPAPFVDSVNAIDDVESFFPAFLRKP